MTVAQRRTQSWRTVPGWGLSFRLGWSWGLLRTQWLWCSILFVQVIGEHQCVDNGNLHSTSRAPAHCTSQGLARKTEIIPFLLGTGRTCYADEGAQRGQIDHCGVTQRWAIAEKKKGRKKSGKGSRSCYLIWEPEAERKGEKHSGFFVSISNLPLVSPIGWNL